VASALETNLNPIARRDWTRALRMYGHCSHQVLDASMGVLLCAVPGSVGGVEVGLAGT